MSMFCFQCQEAAGNTGCTIRGVCGKSPETANIQDQLISLCREIGIAAQTKDQKAKNEAGRYIIQALFSTITNANFDDIRLKVLIGEGVKKFAISSHNFETKNVLSESNEDLRSLKELLIYGLKGIAAYAEHARVLGFESDSVYNFIIKSLAESTISQDGQALTGLVLAAGECAVETMALLDKANTETYGNPELTKVFIGVKNNPGILISGHDLHDMEALLEQTAGTGVDVYTHSEMLAANYYPKFKKYPHFIGNYGNAWWLQDKEFKSFNGAILMTTNCIVPVRPEYKDRIWTTGMAGYPEVPHIHADLQGKKDFSTLIARAKSCQPPTQIEDGFITGGFAHAQVMALADKVVDAIKTGAIKKFVVMAGCDGRQSGRSYFTDLAKALPQNQVILTAGCAKYRYNKLNLGDIGGIPRVLDAGQCNDSYSLAVIALKLKEVFGLANVTDLPIDFAISWYEQKAVAVLLALLHLGFKNIRLGPTLPAFLSPNVTKVLVETFGIMGTKTVEEDMKTIGA